MAAHPPQRGGRQLSVLLAVLAFTGTGEAWGPGGKNTLVEVDLGAVTVFRSLCLSFLLCKNQRRSTSTGGGFYLEAIGGVTRSALGSADQSDPCGEKRLMGATAAVETSQETSKIIQTRSRGSLNQVKAQETVRSIEILEIQIVKVEPYGYPDGQEVGCRRKNRVKGDFKIFDLNTGRVKLPLTE